MRRTALYQALDGRAAFVRIDPWYDNFDEATNARLVLAHLEDIKDEAGLPDDGTYGVVGDFP